MQSAPDYDFQTCVMDSIAKKAGCKPPWYSWSTPDIDECETPENISRYKMSERRMTHLYEQGFIIQKTGCLKPCKYREYLNSGLTSKLRNISIALDLNGKYCPNFIMASTVLNKKKETYVYPVISFVSEIGGSLGLFVGFSFLSIWDWFDPIFDSLLSKKRITLINEESRLTM